MAWPDEQEASEASEGFDVREAALEAKSGAVVALSSRPMEGALASAKAVGDGSPRSLRCGMGGTVEEKKLPTSTLLGLGLSREELERALNPSDEVSGEVERSGHASKAPSEAALRGDTMMGLGPQALERDTSRTTETATLPAGAEFCGDFRIVRVLARGGMGTVYEAEQLSTGRRRALKVLHRRVAPDDPNSQRFLAEARVKSLVDSEHMIDVVVAGVDHASGSLWIAMELLEGETLAERLLALPVGELLPAEESWRVLGQLCRGLSRAHQQGVVHRDLKPANVFLARGAHGPEIVKILDFGIAHIMGSEPGDTVPLGTPLWMAPEQVTRGEITPATDVWAVGLIAFRLFTGFHYWLHDGSGPDSLRALLDEVTTEPLVSATARAVAHGFTGDLPTGFDAWFARCVARDPKHRFPSAREMAVALAEIMPPTSSVPVLDYVAAPAVPKPSKRQRVVTQAVSSARSAGPSLPPRQATAPSDPPPVSRPLLPVGTSEVPVPLGLPSANPGGVEAPRALVPDAVVEAPTVRMRSVSPPPVLSRTDGLHPATGEPDRPWELRAPTDAPEPLRSVPAPRPLGVPRDLKRTAAAAAMAFLLGGVTAYAVHVATTPDTVSLTDARVGPGANASGATALAGPPVWLAGASRAWSGSFVTEHASWSFVLVLQIDGEATVAGRFTWTAVHGPGMHAGEQVTEEVTGSYEPTLGHLELTGTRSSNHLLFPVRTYRLRVTPEGSIVGADARNESARLVGAPRALPSVP
jgi:serine/threonine-protein kinase